MRVKKRIFVYCLVVFVLFFSIFSVFSQNVSTNVTIDNSPPILIQPIPNQTWAGGLLSNSFDLDDYFSDPNGDVLNYSFTQPQNISIIIDSENRVSFNADVGFVGQRTITFHASDGSFNTSSNLVYLNSGNDAEAPQWSNLLMFPVTAFQNVFINFSADWTDNLALKDFNFTIIQGSGTNTSSQISFTGIQNVSFYQFQISVSEGTSVSWYFCASDTTGNSNCTSVQNFVVSPLPESNETVSGEGEVIEKAKEFVEKIFGGQEVLNFTVTPSFFNIPLKQGTSSTRVLTISNIGTSTLSFEIQIESLEDFISFGGSNFSLESGKAKDLVIDFTAGQRTSVGDYFGDIVVKTNSSSKKIPVAIIVNEFELEFEVNVTVSENYKEINPGQEVRANISIVNKKDTPREQIALYYSIKDFDGNIYNSSNETISFSEGISLDRGLFLPSGSELGRYLFYARASSEEFTAIGADTFSLGSLFNFVAIFRFTLIFLVVFILSGFSISMFLSYIREKEKERLLNLYLMLTELRQLVNEGDIDKAVDLYIRVKTAYGEPVSKTALENKEKLKEEISHLSSKLNEKIKHADTKTQNEIKETQTNKGEKTNGKEIQKEETKSAVTIPEQTKTEEKPTEKSKEDEK